MKSEAGFRKPVEQPFPTKIAAAIGVLVLALGAIVLGVTQLGGGGEASPVHEGGQQGMVEPGSGSGRVIIVNPDDAHDGGLQRLALRRDHVDDVDQAGDRDALQSFRDGPDGLVHDRIDEAVLPDVDVD